MSQKTIFGDHQGYCLCHSMSHSLHPSWQQLWCRRQSWSPWWRRSTVSDLIRTGFDRRSLSNRGASLVLIGSNLVLWNLKWTTFWKGVLSYWLAKREDLKTKLRLCPSINKDKKKSKIKCRISVLEIVIHFTLNTNLSPINVMRLIV